MAELKPPRRVATGYAQFYAERSQAAKGTDGKSGKERMIIIAAEWKALGADERSVYESAAALRRKEFKMEQAKFRRSETQQKYVKRRAVEPPLDPDAEGIFDIPIFTPAFLEHCKLRNGELRRLRHNVLELEEHNSTLSEHVDKLRSSVEALEDDTTAQRAATENLFNKLAHLRNILGVAFQNLPLPCGRVVSGGVCEYMAGLKEIITAAAETEFIAKAKAISQSLDIAPILTLRSSPMVVPTAIS